LRPRVGIAPGARPRGRHVGLGWYGGRQFARLLVSEIALHNPSQVDEGRRHRDYQRLKASFDRRRQAYERRFAHAAALQFFS